ncbi:hypothetical protein HQ571_04575 [Candidatus Kuenenbacteria bacterium]|nr:hypothetical protein [Candidatus Kuenenbacteria bacterium]
MKLPKIIRKILLIISIWLAGTLKGIASSVGRLDSVDEENNDKEINTNK